MKASDIVDKDNMEYVALGALFASISDVLYQLEKSDQYPAQCSEWSVGQLRERYNATRVAFERAWEFKRDVFITGLARA